MKSLNLDTAVQVRYARKLIAENVSRRMGEPETKPNLPEWLNMLSNRTKEAVVHEIAKITHALLTKGCDEAAIFIYDCLQYAKFEAANAIVQWKYLIKTGKHSGAQSIFDAVQKLIAKVDCAAYSACYAASIEFDTLGQILTEYVTFRTELDRDLQKIKDGNKQTYPKSVLQRNAEKQEYLSAIEKFAQNVTAWADQIIEDLLLEASSLTEGKNHQLL